MEEDENSRPVRPLAADNAAFNLYQLQVELTTYKNKSISYARKAIKWQAEAKKLQEQLLLSQANACENNLKLQQEAQKIKSLENSLCLTQKNIVILETKAIQYKKILSEAESKVQSLVDDWNKKRSCYETELTELKLSLKLCQEKMMTSELRSSLTESKLLKADEKIQNISSKHQEVQNLLEISVEIKLKEEERATKAEIDAAICKGKIKDLNEEVDKLKATISQLRTRAVAAEKQAKEAQLSKWQHLSDQAKIKKLEIKVSDAEVILKAAEARAEEIMKQKDLLQTKMYLLQEQASRSANGENLDQKGIMKVLKFEFSQEKIVKSEIEETPIKLNKLLEELKMCKERATAAEMKNLNYSVQQKKLSDTITSTNNKISKLESALRVSERAVDSYKEKLSSVAKNYGELLQRREKEKSVGLKLSAAESKIDGELSESLHSIVDIETTIIRKEHDLVNMKRELEITMLEHCSILEKRENLKAELLQDMTEILNQKYKHTITELEAAVNLQKNQIVSAEKLQALEKCEKVIESSGWNSDQLHENKEIPTPLEQGDKIECKINSLLSEQEERTETFTKIVNFLSTQLEVTIPGTKMETIKMKINLLKSELFECIQRVNHLKSAILLKEDALAKIMKQLKTKTSAILSMLKKRTLLKNHVATTTLEDPTDSASKIFLVTTKELESKFTRLLEEQNKLQSLLVQYEASLKDSGEHNAELKSDLEKQLQVLQQSSWVWTDQAKSRENLMICCDLQARVKQLVQQRDNLQLQLDKQQEQLAKVDVTEKKKKDPVPPVVEIAAPAPKPCEKAEFFKLQTSEDSNTPKAVEDPVRVQILCTICGNNFTSPSLLWDHKRTHHGKMAKFD